MSIITDNTLFQAPSWGPIGEDVFKRTYSRTMGNGDKETWFDTLTRVSHGNVGLLPKWDHDEVLRVGEALASFKFLPAGRHLWVTGTEMATALRNCFRAPFTARLADHFEFMGSQLLLGGGVGANYSREYLALADPIRNLTHAWVYITIDRAHPDYETVRATVGEDHFIERERCQNAFVVPDSREGWVSAWGHLFDDATRGIGGVLYDLSEVRPHGAEIKRFGGTASGPAPLAGSLIGCARVLHRASGRHLTGLEAMQCDHEIASAVVAGGARRSARMSIMHWRDPEILQFISAKADHMNHWTTNISVEIDDEFHFALSEGDHHATEVYRAVIDGMYLNGEPGFFNHALAKVGETADVRSTNPCGEIVLEQGEACVIGSVDLNKFGTNTFEASEALRLMARFLVRATLVEADMPITQSVNDRNRRIGVGFHGFQGWAAAHGVKYSDIHKSAKLAGLLEFFRAEIREEADAYCDELGISRCIKATMVAPGGTTPMLSGTQSGISCIIARHCLRNVRYQVGDPRIAEAQDRGLMVEPCVYAQNTFVVSYPMEDMLLGQYDSDLIEQADEVSLHDQLATLAFVTRHFCGGKDGNAVSYTANFDPARMTREDLDAAVACWLPEVKGLTVFPSVSRPQSPFIPITAYEYHSLTARGTVENHDASDEALVACAAGACPIR